MALFKSLWLSDKSPKIKFYQHKKKIKIKIKKKEKKEKKIKKRTISVKIMSVGQWLLRLYTSFFLLIDKVEF